MKTERVSNSQHYLLSNYFVQFVNIIEKDIVIGHGFYLLLCVSFDLFAYL